MMGIGWRGPLIQEGAVNRALTSYPYNDTQGPGARCRYKGSVVIGERDYDGVTAPEAPNMAPQATFFLKPLRYSTNFPFWP